MIKILFLQRFRREYIGDFLHWVGTDVLSLDRLAANTIQDPVLKRMTSRIKKNIWDNCSMAERPYKEISHKLTNENEVICNGNLVIAPETQRKHVIKSVHDNIHCGIVYTQRLKLEAW